MIGDDGLFGEDGGDAVALGCVCTDGGESFSIAVVEDGGLVGWGSAFYGELGENDTGGGERVRIPPTMINFKPKCSLVACGLNHVLALTAEGDVFAWGRNHRGQIGQPPESHPMLAQPVKIAFEAPNHARIAELAAGASHSLAVDGDGAVWSWGENTHGQLGRATTESLPHSPGLVSFSKHNSRATSAAAGFAHSAIVSSDGAVFTFGWGLYHQLGHGIAQDAHEPRQVQALDGIGGGITAAACGSWHTAALSAQGDVYTWGWGPDGQLGPSQRPSEPVPRVVDTEAEYFQQDSDGHRAVQVVCGARFTMVRSQKGDLFCWGNDSDSILSKALASKATSSPRFIAAGHSHALVLK